MHTNTHQIYAPNTHIHMHEQKHTQEGPMCDRIMLHSTHRCSSTDTWITPHIQNVGTQHIDICFRSVSTRAFIQSQRAVCNAVPPTQHESDLQISFMLTTEHRSVSRKAKYKSHLQSSDIVNFGNVKFDWMHFDTEVI